MGLVKLGGVLCLAAVLFGSVCMTIVATMGDGEDPPKIFEQMVLFSCGLFVLGLIISFVGVIIYLNQPAPPKPTAASAGIMLDEDDEEDQAIETHEQAEQAKPKPDPYASEHRRKGI